MELIAFALLVLLLGALAVSFGADSRDLDVA